MSREHIHPTALNERVSLARCTRGALLPRRPSGGVTSANGFPAEAAPVSGAGSVSRFRRAGISSRFPGNNVWVERLISAGKKRKRI